jgi:hypothetical protein
MKGVFETAPGSHFFASEREGGKPAMEVRMANGQRYSFWTHDTVAAAVLAGIGMASLQSKLDGFASELNVPVITALAHGWPMVGLFVSIVLLVVHSPTDDQQKEMDVKGDEEIWDTDTSALNEAVGEGLEENDAGEAPAWSAALGCREENATTLVVTS